MNLLQDAVEAFLLAVSEHVNAGIQSGTYFDKYFALFTRICSRACIHAVRRRRRVAVAFCTLSRRYS